MAKNDDDLAKVDLVGDGTGEPVVRIRGLTIALPPGADRAHAGEALPLDLEARRSLCVVGACGSGRSLRVCVLAGLLPHALRVVGRTTSYEERDLLASTWPSGTRRRRIGMVFQEPKIALNR